jgi:type II secretion system protein N
MKQRLLKYGPWVGYPLFYVFCLLVFAAITFPYDKLKQRIVASYNAQPHGTSGPQELQIDEMSGYWLSGIRARGVRLLSTPSEPGKPPSKILIDEATVRYGMLSALIGNTDVGFDVYAFGGEAFGSYDMHGKDTSLDMTLDAVGLDKVDPLIEMTGLPLKGTLNGKVKLVMPEGKLSKASGSVSLEAKNVAVGDGKAKVTLGMGLALALPKVDIGTLTLAADAKDGVLKITKLVAGGKDVELQGDGRMTLRDSFSDSLCDAQVRFKINDAFRTRSDLTAGLVAALDMSPKVKQAKRPDGFYGWTLRGALGRLDYVAAGGNLGSLGATTGATPK